jgi:hypothetical protein
VSVYRQHIHYEPYPYRSVPVEDRNARMAFRRMVRRLTFFRIVLRRKIQCLAKTETDPSRRYALFETEATLAKRRAAILAHDF